MNIRLSFTSIYNPKANRSERPHSTIERAKELYEDMGSKMTKQDLLRFSWTQNLLPKRITKHSPVEVLFGGYPSGIFEDAVEEELSEGTQNEISKSVSDNLTKMAYEGMLKNSEKPAKEILETGQRVKFTRQCKIKSISKNGTVILANETAAYCIFDGEKKPWWVRSSYLTKL